MFGWFKRNKEPVKTSLTRKSMILKYKTVHGDSFKIEIYPDETHPGTVLIESNGIPIGRFWVADDGISMGVSDTVRPLKYHQ